MTERDAMIVIALGPCACPRPEPDTDCETGDECAMIVVGDPCSHEAQCLCGPERVPGNKRDEAEFRERAEAAACLPDLCFGGMALCAIPDETLFCHDGECGVVRKGEEPPEGADIKDE